MNTETKQLVKFLQPMEKTSQCSDVKALCMVLIDYLTGVKSDVPFGFSTRTIEK